MRHACSVKRLRPALLSAAVGLLMPAISAQASATGNAPPCSGAEYRRLDYWIGDWDVFETDAPTGPAQARARIERIAGGCALHELYEQNDGLIGDSILAYDAVRRQWQQTWVTNRGSLMLIAGAPGDGVLVLEGDVHTADGRTLRQRISWERRGDEVREWAVMSKDGGRTWSPAFDMLFRKRAIPRDGVR